MKRMKKFLAGMLAIACTFSALSMTACELNVDEIIGKVKDELPFDDDKTDEMPDDGTDDGAGETPDDGTDDGAGETPDDGTDDGAGETPDDGTDDGAGETPDDGTDDGTGDEPVSGGITMTDGVQYLRAGGTYALSNSVAFLSTDVVTTSSTYTPVTSTLTATVEPIDADQRVDWAYEWVNASSTWAAGKTLTDYMTIAPKSDGSTSLDVTCKQSFGEPIKITCTSRANNNISASTVVDFLGIPEFKSLTFGTGTSAVKINFDSETIFKLYDGDSKTRGGDAVFEWGDVSDGIYTKKGVKTRIDLVSPAVYYDHSYNDANWGKDLQDGEKHSQLLRDDAYTDGYFCSYLSDVTVPLTAMHGTFEDDLFIERKEDIQEFHIVDYDLIEYLNVGFSYGATPVVWNFWLQRSMLNWIEFSDYSGWKALTDFGLKENSMYTLVLTIGEGESAKKYYSLLKLDIV